ncbi:MAG: hypothetical protein OER95_04900, partial [Acidimicrobiia bacterium]|nr:hypothetical protein [Acidimicrobiia bacterium]
ESITVKVDNTGTTAVTMIVSSPDAPFSVVNSTCGTLRPDQSCRIEVGATTTNIGTYQETLTIKAADLQRSANVNVPVSLTVTPRAPVTDFEFRPKTVTLADDSPTARITLTNTGTTVIDELSRDIEPEKVRVPNTTCVSPNPRALASNRGKLPLAPGESCTFDLLLVDRSPGSEAIEELSITARDVTRTLEIRIDTTVSDRAQITLGPSSIDVSPRESFEVTVTNTGTVALTGLSVGDYAPTAGGPGTRGFRSDCRDDLGVRESCRIVMAVYRQGDSADPLLAGTITVGFGEASADLTVAVDDVPSEPQLPDLSVGFEPDSSFDVACYGASDPTHSGTVILCDLRIVVLVHNAGPGSSPANEVRVTADQHGTRVFSIGALQAGETERYTFLLDGGGNCYDPDCTVSLAVNPNGSVAERREDNNTDVRTITG